LIDPRVVRLRASFNRVKVTKYAIPEKVQIADGLPQGATGKILQTELRKRYLAVGPVLI
jgi:acyl-coenzyme A synthetase/AMP-(fatty) acid ligase